MRIKCVRLITMIIPYTAVLHQVPVYFISTSISNDENKSASKLEYAILQENRIVTRKIWSKSDTTFCAYFRGITCFSRILYQDFPWN